jgi:SWI/SNF-related matrix-associated actin-dependent regulator of chromatin subfamily A3
VEATASGDVKLPSECTTATLSFKGKMVRIHVEGMSTRAAILTSDGLSDLVRNFSVTLTATICGKKAKPITIRGSEPKSSRLSARICPVRIVIYGILNEKEAVADTLSSHGLFLQHPGEGGYDRGVKYINPQYLLPPGEDMPRIENLKISKCCAARGNSTGVRESLGELDRGEILRIFDSACDSDAGMMDTINPSPRLHTKLKRYRDRGVWRIIVLIIRYSDISSRHLP